MVRKRYTVESTVRMLREPGWPIRMRWVSISFPVSAPKFPLAPPCQLV